MADPPHSAFSAWFSKLTVSKKDSVVSHKPASDIKAEVIQVDGSSISSEENLLPLDSVVTRLDLLEPFSDRLTPIEELEEVESRCSNAGSRLSNTGNVSLNYLNTFWVRSYTA